MIEGIFSVNYNCYYENNNLFLFKGEKIMKNEVNKFNEADKLDRIEEKLDKLLKILDRIEEKLDKLLKIENRKIEF